MDNPSELPKKASFTVSFLHAPSRSPRRLPHISPTSPPHHCPPSPPIASTPWTSGVQTAALISTGLIPSHFLKDFNYCLLHLRLISANACISPARAHARKLAERRTCTRTHKAFPPPPSAMHTLGHSAEGFLNKPDRKLNGSDEQRFGGDGASRSFSRLRRLCTKGAGHESC